MLIPKCCKGCLNRNSGICSCVLPLYCNEFVEEDETKDINTNITYIDMLNKESSELLVNSLVEKDRQITELQKQLEEKEKDNQFLKKMYLSEKTKNDNYHTEKYELDKPIEELRKSKLTPEEKERYYKGFDNCERQFATHIVELQQQLKAQPTEIVGKIRKWGQKYYNWVGDGTGYDGQDYNECIGFNGAIDQLNEVLDTILKKISKGDKQK